MQFVSSRDPNKQVCFSQAVTDCIPPDGGMYVPAYEENLRPWILYMNETTSFSSIAGSLTSALLKEEFSPIVSETIAAKAFPFTPELRRLDDRLFSLELFHGPTGSHKDFGVSYLASCLEHILIMQEREAIVMAVTHGDTGCCISQAFRGKKRLKAVLLYVKGTMRGLEEKDFIWNGGNIYPVEIDGNLEDCYRVVRDIYADRQLVSRYGLTLANTVNIGRLLPQTFFYVYAFTRLKRIVYGDIYYALAASNYGNLVAGLYGWKFSLPVNGFITDSTPSLRVDLQGKCFVLDSVVPLYKRGAADPENPSNLDRLDKVFTANPAVLRGMVFPAEVTEADRCAAVKKLFMKYGQFFEPQTASAYAAAGKYRDMVSEDDGTVVLVSRDHPSFSSQMIKTLCGEAPEMPDHIRKLYEPVKPVKTVEPERTAVVNILHEIK